MMPGAYNQVGGLASNPANGISNIPLQGGVGQGGTMGAGATPDRIREVLAKIGARIADSEREGLQAELQELWNDVSTPELKNKIARLMELVTKNADPRRATVDPSTGQRDPTPYEYAQKVIKEVDELTKSMDNNRPAAQAFVFNAAARFAAPQKKKKKTRGNPFKVLMGKVGKLLDHGLAKRDIVRYLNKQNRWNEETIEKAIDIVRDYNRRKRRDDEPEKKESKDKKEAVSQYKRKLMAGEWQVADRHITPDRIEKIAQKKGETLYDIEPDYSKRSTAELIASATWLMSLDSYTASTPQGEGRKAANKKNVKAKLKAIRAALKERGFDDEELDKYAKIA